MVAAAVVLTAPFVPLLFQGEDWGASTPFPCFTDYQDPELGQAVRERRRREFAAFGLDPKKVPDPQASETFLSAKLNWAEVEQEPHSTLLRWYAELIRIRREYRDLSDGRLDKVKISYDEQARWMLIRRGEITVAFNLGEGLQRIPVQPPGATALLRSDLQVEVHNDFVELPPDSVVVLAGPDALLEEEQIPGMDG